MASTSSNKIGNVIRILDNRTIIINVGKTRLSVGDKIKIYEELDPLTDIDGSVLCVFEHTKDILEVVEVEKRYSICQKKETKSMASLAFSPLLDLSKTEYIPLNVSENDIQPIETKTPEIKIGDLVKLA